MSVRFDSAIARRILRPMRPNPLIATLIAMSSPSPRVGRREPRVPAWHIGYFNASAVATPRRGLGDGFWRNVEIIVNILVGRAGAKTGHADENPIFADDRVPALTDSRFDTDAHGRIANDLLALIAVLLQEKGHAGHRDDPRGNLPRGQNAPCLECDRDFR